MFTIRETNESDIADILKIHFTAFGKEEGPEIKELLELLFHDKTAIPILSLAAENYGKMTGHILFTNAQLTGADAPVRVSILAPLAVLPDDQNKGAGGELIKEGLKLLK